MQGGSVKEREKGPRGVGVAQVQQKYRGERAGTQQGGSVTQRERGGDTGAAEV